MDTDRPEGFAEFAGDKPPPRPETPAQMYQRLAAECALLAMQVADTGAKQLFAQMAATWRRLAKRADVPPT